MFDIIKKAEYWECLEANSEFSREAFEHMQHNLKDIQDHFMLSRLKGLRGLKILEIGGSDCRVMRHVADDNECWNAEKFEGRGAGPTKVINVPKIKIAPAYLGDFSAELPDDYFDLVISISVVEHVEDQDFENFFKDIERVLKPGGRSCHAIDAYLFDQQRADCSAALYTSRRLNLYRAACDRIGSAMRFLEQPVLQGGQLFQTDFASNSDREMRKWNKVVPSLSAMRAIAQSVSIKAEWEKGAPNL